MDTSAPQKRLILGVLAISFITLSMSATTPALADIAIAFPNAPQTAVALLATIPSLVAAPCSLLSGRIVGRYVKYRTVSIAGIAVILISGVIPTFLNSLTAIVLMRALTGVGMGFMSPIASSLTMNFLPREEAQIQLGRNAALANAGSIVFQMAGGYACSLNWRYAFLAYLFILPVLVVVTALMPEPGAVVEKAEDQPVKAPFLKETRVYGSSFWLWCALMFLFIVLFYAYITNISSIILNSGYGTATTSAIILSLFGLGGTLGGHFMSKWIARLQKNVFVPAALICALGLLITAFGENLAMMIIGSILFGVGYGMFLPSVSLFAGMCVSAENRAFALAITSIFSGVGTFLSAYIFAALASAVESTWDRLPVLLSSFGYLAVAIGFTIALFFRKRGQGVYATEEN